MDEVHCGSFSGHFSGHFAAKGFYAKSSRHYWWPGMHSEVHRYCRRCLTCAHRSRRQRTKPPLKSIPIGGPFERVGVDIMEFPLTQLANHYILFLNYLTKWVKVYPLPDETSWTIPRVLVDYVIC